MRRLAGGALAALAAMVLLSDWAAAQQTGLFPLAPIRRRRPSCNQQDPVYRLYKEQYFGYHPTLWRKFPAGWGAPSPEAPDAEKSFREIPLETLDGVAINRGDAQPEGRQNPQGRNPQPPEAQEPPADDQPQLPKPPAENTRSPFEMEGPADAPNGAAPPARGEPSPFEGLGPRAGSPRRSQQAAPVLAPPTTTSRASRRRRPAEIDPADAGSPLLSAVVESERADADSALQNVSADEDDSAPQLQPPPRRNRGGSVLSGLGWNVRR